MNALCELGRNLLKMLTGFFARMSICYGASSLRKVGHGKLDLGSSGKESGHGCCGCFLVHVDILQKTGSQKLIDRF